MKVLPKGILGIVTTRGFKVGEKFDPALFESALRLARASESGEVRIVIGRRVLLCAVRGSMGVLVSSTRDRFGTWNGRRRVEALMIRPRAYEAHVGRGNGQPAQRSQLQEAT